MLFIFQVEYYYPAVSKKEKKEGVLHMILGSCVALVTPMNKNGSIDWDVLDNLIEWHISEGTDAIVSMGTTGESATLMKSECAEVIKHTITKVKGRVPVIAGTGTNSTQETIQLTADAKAYGADACLLVVPYYNRPGQEGIYQHFTAIADAVDIPQILYNVPGRTVADMLAETVVRLMPHKNIIGIKEATGDLQRSETLIKAAQEHQFVVYSGDDSTAMELLLQGGKGVISVVANVAPKDFHEMCQAGINGHKQTAVTINNRLAALNKALFVEANPIPVKWALSKAGKIDTGIRLPLTPLSESSKAVVLEALHVAGIKIFESV